MDQAAVPPNVDAQEESSVAPPAAMEFDLEKAAAFKASLEAQQNLSLAIIGGLVAALVGASIWAVVTVATRYQIGWMAVGVGFLVGIVVRKMGKGISKPFGIVGAACALLGCVLGNLFSICGFVSIDESAPLLNVLVGVFSQPMVAVEILRATLEPMDFLFYAIALYEGYKFSFREVTAEELSSLTKPADTAA